ncbi:ATP-binding protein [Emticicia sp. TH156]|uniref:sensor histidine kinase n=1 Tax=Emticicia sp. TH156 TaxID=2067454 RepID=UPI000C78ADDE|nr:ATP-binding protein [Emticicia sp. TH156]PLK45929.1 hypothetical protein C0V77_00810 [Emticicia sp. TH156]
MTSTLIYLLVKGHQIIFYLVFEELVLFKKCLLSNSLKFTTTDPQINIASHKLSFAEVNSVIGLNADKSYFLIDIHDYGIGFEQQYAKQIFTIFQRLIDKQSYAGTGIGMALCKKKIVENQKGHLSATSEPGKGANFIFTCRHQQLKFFEQKNTNIKNSEDDNATIRICLNIPKVMKHKPINSVKICLSETLLCFITLRQLI